MKTLTGIKGILGLAVMAGAVVLSGNARAVEVNLGIGESRPPVVVQPPPQVGRRWVPDQVVRKEERVLVPGRPERREERVLVEPARFIKKEERVLVAPERIERRAEQVLVAPATVRKEWVAPVVERVRVGPVEVNRTVREGFFREVAVPPVYQTVEREVRVPARYDVVARDIEIPARYETRIVEVPSHPRHEVVYKDVVIPGHWEETTVIPPPVVVDRPSRPLIDLNVDFGKKKRE